ncbi:MAG: SUF system Fe-S cluster assembly regulator [Methylococcus sp.]|jgi:FeS assembly SUF system regulator
MLRISKLSDYAIIILGHMAKAPAETFAANDLSASAGIASPTVSKVLKALVRAQVVRSTRGAKGGYQLAKTPEKTSIANIIAALEGPIALTECSIDLNHCEQASSCNVRGNWSVINRAIHTALEAVTLADMAFTPPTGSDGLHIPVKDITFQPRRNPEP